MVRLQLIIDSRVLDALKQALADSPKEFYNTVNQRIVPQAQKRLDEFLNADPGPVKYPFQFATPKSRRYYFATHQPPYRRTGNVRKWRIALRAFSGQTVEMAFENPASYAKYVYADAKGAYQTPGHRNTGWVNVSTVLPGQVEMVLNDLSEAWVEQIGEAL